MHNVRYYRKLLTGPKQSKELSMHAQILYAPSVFSHCGHFCDVLTGWNHLYLVTIWQRMTSIMCTESHFQDMNQHTLLPFSSCNMQYLNLRKPFH